MFNPFLEYDDPVVGRVKIVRQPRAKRVRLTVRPEGEVRVSLPWYWNWDYGSSFVEKNRDWILRTRERMAARAQAVGASSENSDIVGLDAEATARYIETLRTEAKALLPARLAELARFAEEKTGMDFSFNSATVKHNRSNWGSCSRKRNINMNINLMRSTVPPQLRDYVLLHELCHLQLPNHGPRFHALLDSLCPGHRTLSRRLARYTLI